MPSYRHRHIAHPDSVFTKAGSFTYGSPDAGLYLLAWRLVSLQYLTKRAIALLTLSSVCIASVMQIRYLQVLHTTTDITHSMGSIFIWSSVEPAIGIVSSCLICVRPVVRKMLSKMYSLKSQRQSGETSSHKQRSLIFDGHPLDDEICLVVCANSGVRKEFGTPSEGICVTREVELRG